MRFLGDLNDGMMIIPNKKEFKNRPSFNEVTWVPQPDGSIRHTWIQRWEGEQKWTTVYDTVYLSSVDLAEKN